MQISETTINAFTIKEFCRAYGVGRSKAYAEMAAGRLRARKAGRRTLILKADADLWLESLPARLSQAQKTDISIAAPTRSSALRSV